MDLTPFQSCLRCIDRDGPQPGFYYETDLVTGRIHVRECPCHLEWKNTQRLILRAKKANIWYTEDILKYDPTKDYLGTLSKKNVYNLQKYLDKVGSDRRFAEASLYMYGPNGTQKTYLAHWFGLSLLRKKYSVKYQLMNQILGKLTSGFENDDDNKKFRQELLDVDMLIIDEAFSKDKVTVYKSGYQIPFLDSLLRERGDTLKKGTLFISNQPPTAIASQGFSESLQDFITRKTLPINSIFEMKDVYLKNKTSFDVDKLFD